MAEKSDIQWTDATWNPWHGCIKVSPGCKYCYMYRDKERYGQNPQLVLRSKTKFNDPDKWKDAKLIFTCSWSDWFIEEADAWRPEAWEVIKRNPHHRFQILTKRVDRIQECLPPDWGNGYPNVWLGVSIESQDQLERIFKLQNIPATIKFVSAEPLIGPIHFGSTVYKYQTKSVPALQGIDWVIVGGESGNNQGKYKYRPCSLNWIEEIVSDCKSFGVPVFVKQMGTYIAKAMRMVDRHGGDISEFPEHLRVRQMPIGCNITFTTSFNLKDLLK